MMKPAFYTGVSGLVAFQQNLNSIGNNIANSNTNGYKPVETSFRDLLNNKMYVNTPNEPLSGNGVRAVSSGINVASAALIPGNGPLDLAIIGKGWFCVESGGEKMYTRDGSFSISLSGNTANLVNPNGDFVLDAAGNRISATIDSANPNDKEPDTLSKKLMDKVGVYNFVYPEALTPASGNCYKANELTGTATSAKEGDYYILNNYLERSGVSVADEMTNLITAQRSFQLSARVVQTADELEQTINSLRG
ncbi:MAG: flagellar hook-basal body protein [Oscillospiraceae bacterium]